MIYELIEDTVVLHFDDGKANAMGHDFFDAANEGLDRSEKEAKAVVIAGRTGVLSGGFDLKEINKGAEAAASMMSKGAAFMLRLFSHPQPLIIACTGHAIALGGFLLLTADNRIGAAGDFKIGLTETALGMSFPVFGIELAKARLNPAYLTRSFVQSQIFSPEEAVSAGFLDQVVTSDQVMDTAMAKAKMLSELPGSAYARNKLAIRKSTIDTIRASL